jgi:hypothetical protein
MISCSVSATSLEFCGKRLKLTGTFILGDATSITFAHAFILQVLTFL